jgi:site-specific DNA recombinase
MIKKTYGLVRISSHSQNEKNGGTGVEFQTKKLNQYAELNDYEIGEIFVDEVSGAIADRDGITELKELIKKGLVKRVLIWNTSRLFRSMVLFAQFYEMLNKNNVELISVSEGIKSSEKTGEMLFSIMVGISAFEKKVIAERMMSGKITKLNSGVRAIGGRLPFGYKKKDDEIVLDEIDGKIVSFIYKTINEYNKRDYTSTKRTQKMLKLLKKKGYRYKGKEFKNYHLKSILGNEFYVGELHYGLNAVKHLHPTIISKRLFNSTIKGLA